MDPEIANLVPVLDSYWLMIHVSVIVGGSYGPFTIEHDSGNCIINFDNDNQPKKQKEN